MKKSVLFLINGYAIEQKGSYSLYNETLAPNFDMLLKDYIFTKLDTTSLDYIDGYRAFSTGSKGSLNYTFMKKEAINGALHNDSNLLKFKENINQSNSKLHILYFVDIESNLDILRDFLENLKGLQAKEIFVHLICTSEHLKDYKHVKGIITKFGYGYVSGVKLASVVGADLINDQADISTIDDYVTSLFYGYSELWRESDQKISNLIASNTVPSKIKTFCINSRYEIADQDNILIFNYDKLKYTKFMDSLFHIPEKIRRRYESIKYHVYSLYPTGNEEIMPIFQNQISEICVENYLKKAGTKAAIVDCKSRLTNINHCCAGIKNILCENIDYYDSISGLLYNINALTSIINNNKYGLIVLNYNIDTLDNIKAIREEFVKIDQMLIAIYRLCMDQNYSLFISSLYGIKKKLLDGYGNEVFLNLSERVPLIIVDKDLNKTRRKISIYPYGEIFDLAKTIYKNLNPNEEILSLIRPKQSLFTLLFKKKNKK